MVKKLLGITLFVLISVGSVSAQATIEKVQSSFIASFMRYVKWPEQDNLQSFKIGILGNNSNIYNELQKVASGKSIGMATINVVVVNTAEEIKNCQVLFIPSGKISKAKKELTELTSQPIMTVTEEQDYTPDFAVINFKVVNSKLTFQLNSEMAKSKNIMVSNKLSQMATN